MSGNRKLDEIEAWRALVVRILFSILGAILIGYEALIGMNDQSEVRIILILVGVAMMGPVIGETVASLLTALRGGKS